MPNLEEQLSNLGDAAFAASHPTPATWTGVRRRRGRGVLVAAAVVIVSLGSAVLLARGGNQRDLISTDGAGTTVVTDPLDIDLSELAAQSSRWRIDQLGSVMIMDTEGLADGWETETLFLGAGSGDLPSLDGGSGSYEYWQQVRVRTRERVELVVNVKCRADGGAIEVPTPLDAEEMTVRGQGVRRLGNGIEWIEDGRLQISILGGANVPLANIDDEVMELAEELTFIESDDGWTGGSGPALGPYTSGDPVLGGVVAGIEWDVITEGDELVLRIGDDRFLFNHQDNAPIEDPGPVGVSYTVSSISIPGGLVIVGLAPAEVDQIEVELFGGGRVLVPTVQSWDDRRAFAIPVDDRLDPVRFRLVRDGIVSVEVVDLAHLPPYFGGSLTASN